MATIETVSGPVEEEDLGLTLPHEHIRSTSEAVRANFPHLYDEQAELDRAISQFKEVADRGVKTVVEPTCMDLGRDVGLIKQVAEATGLQFVVCTGIYGARYTFLPQYFANREIDELVEAFVHDIEEGIQGTDVKAAFLKSAVDEPGITEDVDKVLRACARASKRTGRPIMSHSHPSSGTGLKQMDVFDEEGVDPATVVIAHTGDTDDLEYIEELLGRGCYIGMDRYGIDLFLPIEPRNATVIELCKRGHAEKMMLSQDYVSTLDWFPAEMVTQMLPKWSFTLVLDEIIPTLKESGVTDEQIDAMMIDAPRRWLA
ncbi:MAG: phosphotriesterase-related protein [Solirubrobacteraceae bacterium]|jgi:phosphotriesterase-related protein|nr:phosphotriesterase-related protein [Solirubrobacteraceae bacterium]